MEQVIEGDCRDDIGGDEQRVNSMDTRYAEIMFKLMLLPVWIAAYLYAGKTFQVSSTPTPAQVVGERPYSIAEDRLRGAGGDASWSSRRWSSYARSRQS